MFFRDSLTAFVFIVGGSRRCQAFSFSFIMIALMFCFFAIKNGALVVARGGSWTASQADCVTGRYSKRKHPPRSPHNQSPVLHLNGRQFLLLVFLVFMAENFIVFLEENYPAAAGHHQANE